MKRLIIIIFSAFICGAVLKSCGSGAVVTVKSSDCDILEFIDEVNFVNWEINGSIITATYPAGADISLIAPIISVSDKATVSPESGEKIDFSNEKEVVYTVTAEDGTKNVYKARATVDKSIMNNSCGFDNPLTELAWLKAKVDEITLLFQGTPVRVTIYQCIYGDRQTGFLEDRGSTKFFYTCTGDLICILGGDAGEICSELNIANEKLVWKINH